ncbi:MAG: KH domain-containing protein [candidate division WWE3 bacterium]|nr:KH domain-containing protein [candidate division WWE3 bacterium]
MPEKIETLQNLTTELIEKLAMPAKVSVTEVEGTLGVSLDGENLGILIGYHGETLASLQTWLALALYNKYGEWVDLRLDISGYASEREARLREIATNACDRARFLDKAIDLPPMPPFERRLIHTVIGTMPGMKSESAGEGYERHIVVSVVK